MHNVWIFVTTPWWHLAISIIYLVIGLIVATCFIADENYHEQNQSETWDRYVVGPVALTFLWLPAVIVGGISSAFEGRWIGIKRYFSKRGG